MAQSVIKTVIARYKSVLANGHPWARVQVPFAMRGMERFDTAHLVHRRGRWFLHVPMTKDVSEMDLAEIRQGVGLDFGINFLVTAYDSQGQTTFFP
ncbi:MAG: PhoPQ-activated pathogenicity-related family protein, partial [Firmicutes bacterium]|nr:PhoPQ-activated pathogenicity-related family protein [Bacillota bacterium]